MRAAAWRARGGRRRLVEPQARGNESVDPVLEWPVPRTGDLQQWRDPLRVPGDRGAHELVLILEVAVHRPQRHPRPRRDVRGGGGERALAEEVDHRVEDEIAVAITTRGAPVDGSILRRDLRHCRADSAAQRRLRDLGGIPVLVLRVRVDVNAMKVARERERPAIKGR